MSNISLTTAACAVVVGSAPLLWLPAMPMFSVRVLLFIGGVSLLLFRTAHLRIPGLILLSLTGACINAQEVLDRMVQIDGKPLHVEISLAEARLFEQQDTPLLVRVEKINDRWVFPAFYARVTVPQTMANACHGQRWQAMVRLRPLHSRLNEGGFDRQRWGVATRQLATGNITTARVLETSCSVRQRVITRMEQQSTTLPWRGILLALAFGEMKTITSETRTALVQTGTLHLMVISGLHIGLAALFGWSIMRAIQRLLPTAWIGHWAPLVMGVTVAWLYVWLAGSNPPAVRAALAFSIWALIRAKGIVCTAWQVWLWCIALLLLSDPLMMISNSFWLSGVAVAALIFWCQWVPLPERYRRGWRWAGIRLAHLQIGMTLLLMPLQWSMFHGTSMASLATNLWAVPVVSFVITPLVLLAIPLLLFPALSHAVWVMADGVLDWVLTPLFWLQSGWIAVDERFLYASLLGWSGVIIWRFAWWRTYPASVLALGGAVLLSRVVAQQPEWRLDMLDVGHGLAIVIERQGNAILYDTGGQWPGGDMALREIIPYLRWRGMTLDAVIISHSHQDHIGGLASLQQAYPNMKVYSPLTVRSHRACVQGERWQWRNLTFTVLWPPQPVDYAENDDSCVVQIDDGTRRVLLTGDIEKAAERHLVATQRDALAADLLQIPHHGSQTSSTVSFLQAVNADYALASTGRYNPWRLPSNSVVKRYRQRGQRWVDTAHAGQVSVRFFGDKWTVCRYREQLSPRWYHQWFGVRRDNE